MGLMLVVNIVGWIIFLFVGVFVPSYFKEKGKNLATKEDIGEITTNIEEVKSKYSEELENIRSDLATTLHQQNTVTDLHRQAMLNLFDVANVLLFDALHPSFGSFPVGDGTELYEYQKTVERLFTDLVLAYTKLIVFSGPEAKYLKEASQLVVASSNIKDAFREKIVEVSIAFKELHSSLGKGDDELRAHKALEDAILTFNTEVGPPRDSAKMTLRRYMYELNPSFSGYNLDMLPGVFGNDDRT